MVGGIFDALRSEASRFFSNHVDLKKAENNATNTVEDTEVEDTEVEAQTSNENNSKSSEKTSKAESTKVYQPLPLDASLTEHIDALRVDALYTADLKATRAYEEMKKIQGNVDLLTDTLEKIAESSDTDSGALDISGNLHLQECFKELKELGIQIPDNKNNFTKDERDRLIKTIERKEKALDVDLKQAMQKVSESIKERNEWYQELKALYDKHDRIISTILNFMKQAAR